MQPKSSERRVAWALCLSIAAILCLLLTAPLPSQSKTVKVANLATHARTDVVTSVVPWRQGEYHGEPLAGVQHHRFGALWPDGSHRMTRLHFPISLAAGEINKPAYSTFTVERASATTEPLPAFEIPKSLAGLSVSLKIGTQVTPLVPTQLLESGPLVVSAKCVARVPNTPLWAVLALSAKSKCDNVNFWLWFGTSDPRVKDTGYTLPAIYLRAKGASIKFHHDGRFKNTEGALTRAGKWGEGQSQMVAGRFLLPTDDVETLKAEQQIPTLAVSTDWKDSGTYGPFGNVAVPPVDLTSEFVIQRAIEDYKKHTDDPWAINVHGLDAYPGRTGDQPAFGVVAHVLPGNGHPEILYSIQRSVYQEAIRPIFYREADGSIFEYRDHPSVHFWNRAIFRTSPDKLGKRSETPSWDVRRSQPAGVPPVGPDRQHDVQTSEQEYAMLTGDLGALMLRGALIESALASYTVSSGNQTIDGLEAPRAVGRGMHLLAWDYFLSGRDDVRQCIDRRAEMIQRTWVGRNTGPLKFMSIIGKDHRNLGGRWPFGFWWQEMIGVRGLAAAYNMTGSPAAKAVALECATSMATMLEGPLWRTPKNIAQPSAEWENGGWVNIGAVPPAPLEGGPPVIEYYDGYKEWVLPGFDWLATVTDNGAVRTKCQQFRAHVLSLYADGPSQWAKARLEKRMRVARWAAVR